MRRKIWVVFILTALVLATLCAMTSVLAEGDYEGYTVGEFNDWYIQAKEAAKSADHILGPSDIDTIQSKSLTIISPGDTIAIVPDAAYNTGGVQGGNQDTFHFDLIQLKSPVYNKDFLYAEHTPSSTIFTEEKTTTMKLVFGSSSDYNIPKDALKEVTYVSLYKNNTGYPVILRGNSTSGQLYTETSNTYYGMSTLKTDSQKEISVTGDTRYAPMFYFVEPTYQINVWQAAGDGRSYEWAVSNPVTSITIYMDRKDRTYEVDNPTLSGRKFVEWNTFPLNDGYNNAFPITEKGKITGNKTTFSYNMQEQLYKHADATGGQLKHFAHDFELAARWAENSNTVRFHAGDGTINDMKTLLVEVGSSFKMSDYKAIWNGHTFNGWGSSESDPNGTLLSNATADNQSIWFSGSGNNMDVYAAWSTAQYTVRFDPNGGTGSMNSQTMDAGTRYTLPVNGFTAPAGMEFDKWDAGIVGSQIEINTDTVIKAIWKDLPVQTCTVSFDANGGTGNMANVTVNAGASYTLPANSFIAPAGKEFDSWDAGAAGSQIVITADTVIKATWKDQTTEPVIPETVVVYTCIEGSGGSWERESSGTLRFVFKRNVEDHLTFSRFAKIQVDGKDVGESNYTKEAGSVIITLKQAYLNTLSTGTHTLSAYFSDSDQAAKADASFTIRDKTEEYVVPQTGDDEPLLLWTLITLVGLSLILGAVWTGKQRKIRK